MSTRRFDCSELAICGSCFQGQESFPRDSRLWEQVLWRCERGEPVSSGSLGYDGGGKVAEAAGLQAVENSIPQTRKDKSCLLGVIGRYLEACEVDRRQPVLVLGGEQEDTDILAACGFEQ